MSRIMRLISVLLFMLSFPIFLHANTSGNIGNTISVTNIQDGMTLRHPVVLLEGILPLTSAEIFCENTTSTRSSRNLTGVTYQGYFKVLAELVPGENTLFLHSGDLNTSLKLTYVPPTSKYTLRFFYWTDNSGRTDYQTQIKDDPQNWEAKISTAAKLMQTFTAQQISSVKTPKDLRNPNGYGHRTFNLEYNAGGDVIIHKLVSKKNRTELHSLHKYQLYSQAKDEIKMMFPAPMDHNVPCTIDVIIIGFTEWNPDEKILYGHTALGGWGQAMFGSAGLFTWANSLNDVSRALNVTTKIDPSSVADDSGGRNTFWANAATGYGATLHEIGHALGLPHDPNRFSIMSRGFDHFGRFFLFSDAPSRWSPIPHVFQKNHIALWPEDAIYALCATRFMDPDTVVYPEKNGYLMAGWINKNKDFFYVTAENGIRFFSLDYNGETTCTYLIPTSEDTDMPVKNIQISRSEMDKIIPEKTGSIQVRILDKNGMRWQGNISR